MRTEDIKSRVSYDLSPKALELWNQGVHAATDEENTISIFDVIGVDYWTGEGVTAKRISAALRSIGDNDVTVNINSPGGDMFEGLAIYNLLREHKGKVTVKVLSLAASAASIIAMAGDEIKVARAGFLMIHNAWVIAAGNRHELQEVSDWLEPFDSAMADVYAAQTGQSKDEIQQLMDSETWLAGSAAIDQGFASSLLDSDEVEVDSNAKSMAYAARKFDTALAKTGMPRTERKKLLDEIKSSMRDAAGSGKPGATEHDKPGAIDIELDPLPRLQFNH